MEGSRFDSWTRRRFGLATGSAAAAGLLGLFGAAETEETIARDEQGRAQSHLAQSHRGPPIVEIVQPAPAAALRGDVGLQIVIRNVTPAILDAEPPAHQRIFLWINQHILSLDDVNVSGVGTSPPPWTHKGAVPFGGAAPARVRSASMISV